MVVIEQGSLRSVVAESGAICETLCERFGQGRFAIPPGTEDDLPSFDTRSQYLYWTQFAEGSCMNGFMQYMIFSQVRFRPPRRPSLREATTDPLRSQIPKAAPWFVRPIIQGVFDKVLSSYVKPSIRNNIEFVEKHLEGKDFFVGGKLTGADSQSPLPFPCAA